MFCRLGVAVSFVFEAEASGRVLGVGGGGKRRCVEREKNSKHVKQDEVEESTSGVKGRGKATSRKKSNRQERKGKRWKERERKTSTEQ